MERLKKKKKKKKKNRLYSDLGVDLHAGGFLGSVPHIYRLNS